MKEHTTSIIMQAYVFHTDYFLLGLWIPDPNFSQQA